VWLLVCSTVSAKASSSTFRKIIYLAKLSSKKGHTPYFHTKEAKYIITTIKNNLTMYSQCMIIFWALTL